MNAQPNCGQNIKDPILIFRFLIGLVVSVVDPHPGESIIDCCAAPGGKTLCMASSLSGQGILVNNVSTNISLLLSSNYTLNGL